MEKIVKFLSCSGVFDNHAPFYTNVNDELVFKFPYDVDLTIESETFHGKEITIPMRYCNGNLKSFAKRGNRVYILESVPCMELDFDGIPYIAQLKYENDLLKDKVEQLEKKTEIII